MHPSLLLLALHLARAEEPPVVVDHVFPSGLRLQLAPDPALPVVGFATVIDAGSASDPADRPGLAHLVEHLVFRAVHPARPPHQELLAAMGCDANAETSFDTVSFTSACPAAVFAHAWQAELRRLVDPLAGVDEAGFLAEREVVLAEAGERTGASADLLRGVLAVMHPPEHPYGHLPIGDPAHVRAASLEDARRFARERYRPSATTIVVTGDFDPGKALSLLLRTLPAEALGIGPLDEHDLPLLDGRVLHGVRWPSDPDDPGRPLASRPPVRREGTPLLPPLPDATVAVVPLRLPPEAVEDEGDAVLLGVGWVLPPVPLDDAIDVRPWLGPVTEQALRRATRQDDVACLHLPLRDEEVIACELVVPGRKAEPVLAGLGPLEVSRELQLDRSGHDAEELAEWIGRVDEARVAALDRELEPVGAAPGGRAAALALHAHEGHAWPLRDGYLYRRPTRELGAAAAYLDAHLSADASRRFRIDVQVRPEAEGGAADLPPASATAVTEALLPEALRDVANPLPPLRGAWSVWSHFRAAAVEAGTDRIADVAMFLPWGRRSAPPLVAELVWDVAARSLSGGGGGRGAPSGDEPYFEVRDDHVVVGVRTTPERVPERVAALGALAQGAFVKSFATEAVKRRWRRARAKGAGDPEVRATALMRAHLGLRPLSLLDASDEDFEAAVGLDFVTIEEDLRLARSASGVAIVVAGRVDTKATLAAIRRAFETWLPDTVPPPVEVPLRDAGPPLVVVRDVPHAPRVTVSTVCGAPGALPRGADAVVRDVLARRQAEEVRDRLGLAYVTGAWVERDEPLTLVELSTSVAPADVLRALQAQRRLLDGLGGGVLDDAGLEAARRRVTLRHALEQQTTRALVDELGRTLLAGGEPEDVRATDGVLVDPAAVRGALAACTERLVVRLEGDAEQLDAIVRGNVEGEWEVVREDR